MASFPGTVASFPTRVDGVDTNSAADVNNLGAEVTAVESNLLNGLQFNLLPDADNTRALGSSSKTFSNIYGKLITQNGTAITAILVMPTVVTLTDGATPALDASLGTVFRLAAAGDRTIAIPTNPVNGQKIVIEHFASAGARTLALNTGAGGFRFGSDITALTQTVSGKTDYIGAIYNGTDSKWDVVAYTKGF